MVMRNLEKSKQREGDGDRYLPTLTHIFTMAKWFGIPSYGSKFSKFWALTILLMMMVIEGAALWKLIKVLAGIAIHVDDGRGVTARLSGSIFYANALVSLFLSWRFILSWKRLSFFWSRAEVTEALYLRPDKRIHSKVVFVSCLVAMCATAEHMLSMVSATGFDFPPLEFFRTYILNSHGFILTSAEAYSLWTAIPIFFLSKIATILWNFQDLIIILISMGLTSRYHRLNLYVNRVIKFEKRNEKTDRVGVQKYVRSQQWRRIREAYVRQAALVRMVDANIGPLILLSNINNFYFICLQLFLGLNKSQGSVISSVYYFISLGWLIFRACGVVLAAADVHVHSKMALACINTCPSAGYNVEIKRLNNQLINDYVALSGMGFFWLDRHMLLEVAGNIIKYELVLVQYDN